VTIEINPFENEPRAEPQITGSWSNDAELIGLCMKMLEDVPGDTLDQRVERLVSWYLSLQEMHGATA
jgi:hypothetical protein